jgi:CRP-like cAMP-binding protein
MTPVYTIRHSPLLAGVDAALAQRMAIAMTEESWPLGAQIMGPHDSVERFRIIVSGRVKIVSSNSHSGRELTLWLLGAGDGFDIVSLLDGKPHAVSAWALTPVHSVAAPQSAWAEWMQHSAALELAVHRYVGGKLRELTALATDLAVHDTVTRLSHLLLRHFDGSRPNLLRDLPQSELAAMIGSVRVVLSRALTHLREAGVVGLHRGAIDSVDLKRLLARAETEAAHRAPRTTGAPGERRS